ncbi:MAG: thioredoxin family protein [Acidobacteriota bacterium]
MIGRILITLCAFTVVAVGMVFLLQEQDKAKHRAIKISNDDSLNTVNSPTNPKIATGNTAIPWQTNLDKALALAKANNTQVVVDVYTDWCGWCKRMDKDIYTHPQIISLSSRYVFLKLNAEDSGQGSTFARKNNVEGYPTTVIIDGNGRYLRSVPGYPPSVQAFASFIERG